MGGGGFKGLEYQNQNKSKIEQSLANLHVGDDTEDSPPTSRRLLIPE